MRENIGAATPLIVIDGRWISDTPSGIGVYTRELLARVPALAPLLRFHVIFRSKKLCDEVSADCGFSSFDNVTTDVVPYGPFSPKSQLLLPLLLRGMHCSVFHTPNFITPYFAFPRNLHGHCRCVATIHDIIPLVVDGYAPNSRISKFKRVYRECVRQTVLRSHAVITVSACAKEDIVREFKLNAGMAARINVIFDGVNFSDNGVAHSPVKPVTDSVSPRTLLYVGRMDPYKNVPMLVDALKEIQSHCKFPVRLRVVGPKDDRYPEAELRAAELGLSDAIEFTGFVSDKKLIDSYRTADLLTHPSRYEGFGLQLIEAMNSGLPVLCTDGGSQPEVAGNAAVVVHSDDSHEFAAAAVEILSSPERQEILRRRGLAHAKRFSWDTTAAETVAIYRSLLEGGGPL